MRKHKFQRRRNAIRTLLSLIFKNTNKMKYQKKPQIIEAVQHNGDADETLKSTAAIQSNDSFVFKEHDQSMTVADGQTAPPGDYILPASDGSWSVEAKDAFEADWEPVPDNTEASTATANNDATSAAASAPQTTTDHVVTQEDLDANPDLAENGIGVGTTIQLPNPYYTVTPTWQPIPGVSVSDGAGAASANTTTADTANTNA